MFYNCYHGSTWRKHSRQMEILLLLEQKKAMQSRPKIHLVLCSLSRPAAQGRGGTGKYLFTHYTLSLQLFSTFTDVISLLGHPHQIFLCLACSVSSWSHVTSTYPSRQGLSGLQTTAGRTVSFCFFPGLIPCSFIWYLLALVLVTRDCDDSSLWDYTFPSALLLQ